MNREETIADIQNRINKVYLAHLIFNPKLFAEAIYNAGYRKIPDGAVVMTAEELALYETNYDKVYEQAKADIIGIMADGGTSCHWCMDEHYQKGRKETATSIFKKAYALYTSAVNPEPAFHKFIQEMIDEYGFEIEVEE